MLAILVFLLVLSVLVLIHELGHYFAARACGVKADEFGYGFPPRLFAIVRDEGKWKFVSRRDQRQYKNTVWSLNWLPLGGFVRLKGENGDQDHDPDSFISQRAWKRLVIIAAGVAMNWLLAVVIFSGGFMVGVPAQIDSLPPGAKVIDQKVQIVEVVKDSPSDKAGMQPGDYLIGVNGKPFKSTDSAKDELAVDSKTLKPFPITIERAGKPVLLSVTPVYLEELKRPGIGIALADTGTVKFPVHLAIVNGFRVAYGYTQVILGGLYGLVHDLFVQHKLTSEVSGPVGIAVMTGKLARQGVWNVLQFTALLSLNLAIINFFPIPALDGGRAVLILTEYFRRKKVNPKFEANLHRIGFALLMILIILVTVNDIRQYGVLIWNHLLRIVGL